MSQQQNDMRKMEKIRKLLDNPDIALSNDRDNKYLLALQKRLLHDSSYQPYQTQERTGTEYLKPSVIIHHQKPALTLLSTPLEPPIVVREKSKEGQQLFDDEELFEIERMEDAFIPEFVEVKSPQEKEEHISDKTNDFTASQPYEPLEELPQWQPVEEESIQTTTISKIDDEDNVQPKRKLRLLKSFKGFTVRQSAKEPEIWEEEDTKEHRSQTMDTSSWETENAKINNKKNSRKISRKSVSTRYDKSSLEAEAKEINTIEPQQKQPKVDEAVEIKSPRIHDDNQSSYSYNDYRLYRKHLRIGGKEIRTVHFFSKDIPEDSEPALLPDGYSVQVNEKTGVPYIKKIH